MAMYKWGIQSNDAWDALPEMEKAEKIEFIRELGIMQAVEYEMGKTKPGAIEGRT
jgi:hypothetical protein